MLRHIHTYIRGAKVEVEKLPVLSQHPSPQILTISTNTSAEELQKRRDQQ